MISRGRRPFSTIIVLFEGIGSGRYRPVMRQYTPFETDAYNYASFGMIDLPSGLDRLPIFDCIAKQGEVVVTGFNITAVGDPYCPDRQEAGGVSRDGFTPTALDSCGGAALRSFIASSDARWGRSKPSQWPTSAVGSECHFVFIEPERLHPVLVSSMTINVMPRRAFQVDPIGADVSMLAQTIRIEISMDSASR